VSEKKKMHCCERFTGLSLLLLLLQCNRTLDSQRKSQPAYQEQQHGESPREEELICNCLLFGLWGARLQLDLSSLQLCAVDTERDTHRERRQWMRRESKHDGLDSFFSSEFHIYHQIS
jgi:hypothetical protein